MISTSVPVLAVAVAAVLLPAALVSSMPEHAKRYRDNANQISQHHHASARSGKEERMFRLRLDWDERDFSTFFGCLPVVKG